MILAGPDGTYEGPRVGRYSFNPEGLAFGIDALNRGRGLPVLVLDEIGPLELAGKGFTDAVHLVREEKAGNQIVVIRKELLSSFMPLFDKKPLVFETTISNRDQLPGQIGQIVTEILAVPR